MSRAKFHVALTPIAIGRQIVGVGETLPGNVNSAKIDSLLSNQSVEGATDETLAEVSAKAKERQSRHQEINRRRH